MTKEAAGMAVVCVKKLDAIRHLCYKKASSDIHNNINIKRVI